MKKNHEILAVLLGVLVCGCDRVTADRPIGSKAVDLSGQLSKWNGTWTMLQDDSLNELTVTDPTNGLFIVKTISKKQPNKKEPDAVTKGYLRQQADSMFLTWSFQDPKGGTNMPAIPFMWGRIKRIENIERDVILVWTPRLKKVADLVNRGIVEGTQTKDAVRLTDLKAAHLDLLSSDESATLFDWDEPLIFIREK